MWPEGQNVTDVVSIDGCVFIASSDWQTVDINLEIRIIYDLTWFKAMVRAGV